MSAYILVVEDEPDVRELFKITLSMAGYRTEVANDGLEAMAAIAKEPPELVLLDLMMPHLDGFGVLTRLREEQPNGEVKVLVATAKALNEKDEEQLSSWPVVGVLNKGELDIARMVLDVKKILAEDSPSPELPHEDEEHRRPHHKDEVQPPHHKDEVQPPHHKDEERPS